MAYDPAKHNRQSIRLKGFNCAAGGAYFVTICTRGRACVFGTIQDDKTMLSQRGLIVQRCWNDIATHRPYVEADAFVIMPNHVQGVLWVICDDVKWATQVSSLQTSDARVGATLASSNPRPRGPGRDSLGAIIGSYKAAVSRVINRLRPYAADHLWQPNYYEHIVRTENALGAIREYIVTNPLRWSLDNENPDGIGGDDFDAFLREIDRRCVPKPGNAGVTPTKETR